MPHQRWGCLCSGVISCRWWGSYSSCPSDRLALSCVFRSQPGNLLCLWISPGLCSFSTIKFGVLTFGDNGPYLASLFFVSVLFYSSFSSMLLCISISHCIYSNWGYDPLFNFFSFLQFPVFINRAAIISCWTMPISPPADINDAVQRLPDNQFPYARGSDEL